MLFRSVRMIDEEAISWRVQEMVLHQPANTDLEGKAVKALGKEAFVAKLKKESILDPFVHAKCKRQPNYPGSEPGEGLQFFEIEAFMVLLEPSMWEWVRCIEAFLKRDWAPNLSKPIALTLCDIVVNGIGDREIDITGELKEAHLIVGKCTTYSMEGGIYLTNHDLTKALRIWR